MFLATYWHVLVVDSSAVRVHHEAMKTALIAPGLTLDEQLYEAAAAGLLTAAPDLAPLTWERFTAAPDWALIPDESGACYKAELTLVNTIEQTIRINQWFLPDLRGGQAPKPHNHPWAFTSHILAGGYSEDRYDAGAAVPVEHVAGGTNVVPRDLYHEVTEIHDRTLSLMVCGRGLRGTWGYLDLDTGCHRPAEPDPHFSARFAALNPHLR